ncbi:phage tail tape measure protein [Rodentibacter abscessus]|uniref:phage tail tape measure protein n=1 Tax=Rodentibacter abscessus TaxID=3381777 RepID=UPI00399C56F5
MAKMTLALALKAQDYASRVIDKMRGNVNKATDEQQRNVQRTAQVTQKSYRSIQEAMRTRERLGIRSENAIQAEIAQTIASYNKLKASGVLSARALAREAEATKRKIASLNAEMGKTSMGQRLGDIGRGVASIGAGAMAGAMVMAQPMKKEMDYDRRLAMVSNTAFSDRDVAGRIAGKKELHKAVQSAVEIGGGTKEEALGALDTMLASGAVKADTAMKLLPTLQKAAVATGADTNDLAKIAISSMQQFGISEDQIGAVLDKAVAAGQAGNFELSDMARWLPKQMAAGKAAGLSGMNGLEALLMANQQARVTAGSEDEAGNNLSNLLVKISAKETNERFRKLEIKGKDGKTHGIDFIKSMENEKKQGKNSLEAFMSIMDMVIGQDEKYKELQKKLKTAKKEEQAGLIKEMSDLVEGTAIGKIVSDQQALMALLGMRNNVQLGKEVQEQIQNSNGAIDKSHAVVQDTNSAKVENAKNALEFAQMEGMKGFNNALGDVATKIAEYAKTYPDLTATLTTAGTVITALSTAAIAASGALALIGGLRGRGGMGRGWGMDDISDFGRSHSRSNVRTARGKRGFKPGTLFSPPNLVLGGLMFAADNHDNYFAQKEEQEEKNRYQERISQAYAETEKNKPRSVFQYAPIAPAEVNKSPSVWAQANGAYEIADIKRREAIAQARLVRGTLTQAQYDERVMQGQNRINTIKEQGQQALSGTELSSYSGLSAIADDPTSSFNHPPQTRYIDNPETYLSAKPTALLPLDNNKTDGVALSSALSSLGKTLMDLSVLSGYQEDFQQFGQTISEGLKTAIESQHFTIQNEIKVDLDGRIVAEQSAEYQYQDMKRWG